MRNLWQGAPGQKNKKDEKKKKNLFDTIGGWFIEKMTLFLPLSMPSDMSKKSNIRIKS